ncbi:MAG TPA: hypothetical protein VKS20_12170 [Candidatus Acidoferrales bacterium]|nr:hypothetical protein [Candidatus Acidoferrales bacterium]
MRGMLKVGIIITAATVAIVFLEALRHRKYFFPYAGWFGLATLAGAEWLMFRHVEPVATYFTPIAWSAYLLICDSAVFAVSGRSRLRNAPRDFFQMALLSIPLWLIFEAYNLRLQNWTYVGVPRSLFWALVGYGWSFATITPAILETGELVESFGWFKRGEEKNISPVLTRNMMIAGALCLAMPAILPRHVAAYLFGLVWVGFYLLLDPLNCRLGLPSLLGDISYGRWGRFCSLLVSGWICGWLWEFWNYWAAAKWYYIFPIFQKWKIFEMPAPGYLGFIPFALECFVMYVTAAWLVRWIPRSQDPRIME